MRGTIGLMPRASRLEKPRGIRHVIVSPRRSGFRVALRGAIRLRGKFFLGCVDSFMQCSILKLRLQRNGE